MEDTTFEYLVSDNGGKSYRVVASGLSYRDCLVITHRAITQRQRRQGKDFRFRTSDGVPIAFPVDELAPGTDRLDT